MSLRLSWRTQSQDPHDIHRPSAIVNIYLKAVIKATEEVTRVRSTVNNEDESTISSSYYHLILPSRAISRYNSYLHPQHCQSVVPGSTPRAEASCVGPCNMDEHTTSVEGEVAETNRNFSGMDPFNENMDRLPLDSSGLANVILKVDNLLI
jgi:hypothetical protein